MDADEPSGRSEQQLPPGLSSNEPAGFHKSNYKRKSMKSFVNALTDIESEMAFRNEVSPKPRRQGLNMARQECVQWAQQNSGKAGMEPLMEPQHPPFCYEGFSGQRTASLIHRLARRDFGDVACYEFEFFFFFRARATQRFWASSTSDRQIWQITSTVSVVGLGNRARPDAHAQSGRIVSSR